jgi:hypothetical protein
MTNIIEFNKYEDWIIPEKLKQKLVDKFTPKTIYWIEKFRIELYGYKKIYPFKKKTYEIKINIFLYGKYYRTFYSDTNCI